MSNRPQPHEPRQPRQPVVIDEVLKNNRVCRLGAASNVTVGICRLDSHPLATLGGEIGDTLTRTILLNTNSTYTVAETLADVNFGVGTTIGREIVGGGTGVSKVHARLTIDRQSERYLIEDLDSLNGIEVFRPTPVEADGEVHEFADNDRAAVVTDLRQRFQIFISIGDTTIIRVSQVPDGPFIVEDAIALSKERRPRFKYVKEGGGVTIGRRSDEVPAHLSGEILRLPATDIDVAHLRLLFKEGRLYILNYARQPFAVMVEDKREVATPSAAEPPVTDTAAAGRLPSIILWRSLRNEVVKLEQRGMDRKAQFRALARNHHPDQHPGNPNKARLMQIINELYNK